MLRTRECTRGSLGLITALILSVPVLTPAPALARSRPVARVPSVPLLSLARGSFEISLGPPPARLPLSGVPETLTLIGGPPRSARVRADNAYVGFIPPRLACASTPAASRRAFTTISAFYSSARSARRAGGSFAPDGGASAGTFLASVPGIRIRGSGAVRACVWIAPGPGASAPRARQGHVRSSLRAAIVVPLLNHVFAASVSDLAGADQGGYVMDAFDGGTRFSLGVSNRQCSSTVSDPTISVAGANLLEETVAISGPLCPSDASSFSFSGPGLRTSLTYPVADAVARPAISLGTGGCELDPLTGATLSAAADYLAAVGCRVGRVESTPAVRTLGRGLVSWASVSGGVAAVAPPGTAVDLVLNG